MYAYLLLGPDCIPHYLSAPFLSVTSPDALSPPPRLQVKLALQVLLQHHLVTFSVGRAGMVEYTLHPQRVLLLLRYAR